MSINRMKSNNNNKRERKETKRRSGIFSSPSKFVLLFEKWRYMTILLLLLYLNFLMSFEVVILFVSFILLFFSYSIPRSRYLPLSFCVSLFSAIHSRKKTRECSLFQFFFLCLQLKKTIIRFTLFHIHISANPINYITP